MSERTSRQGFLGEHSDALLETLRVGIIGLGGGGSHIAQQLAHLGVKHFSLFDPDRLEESNLNRTVSATHDDATISLPKVAIAERAIRAVNPHARAWTHQGEWQTAMEAVRECDVIFSCVDGFAQRSRIEETCRRHHIPLIDIGMDVHKGEPFTISGQVVTSIPGGPCFKCLSFIRDRDLEQEGRRYGEAGHRPQVVWPNGTLASTAVGVFVRLFMPWSPHDPNIVFLAYDGNKLTTERDVRFGYAPSTCLHFVAIGDLGDPFWKPSNVKEHGGR